MTPSSWRRYFERRGQRGEVNCVSFPASWLLVEYGVYILFTERNLRPRVLHRGSISTHLHSVCDYHM